MVASAACSSSNASGSDAATASIDAVTAVDAQHFDAGPPGSLDIVVLDPFAGGPVSGTVVVVEQPDSAPIELTTDSSGHAATTINETATVTALVSSQSGPWFRSVLGVERGDTITVGSNATPGRTTFTFKMDVPAPDTSSVTSVEFAAGGCGSFEDVGPTPTTETVTVHQPCDIDQVVVSGLDASFHVVEYLEQANPTVSAGATVTLTAPWIAATSNPISFTDIPSTDSLGYGYVTLYDQNSGFISSTIDGFFLPGNHPSSIDTTVHLPKLSNDVQSVTTWADGQGGNQDIQIRGDHLVSPIDVGAHLVPWLDDFTTYDATTRTVSWTEQGPGSVDGIMVAAFATDSNGSASFTWEVMAPPGTTSITMPHLPAAYTSIDPASTTATKHNFATSYVANFPSVPYATVRANPIYNSTDIYGPWLGAINTFSYLSR